MKNIQENIYRHIFDKNDQYNFDASLIEDYPAENELKQRLDVHRQTILENLVNTLKITYPYIWSLIGESCARGVALSYIHEPTHLLPIQNSPISTNNTNIHNPNTNNTNTNNTNIHNTNIHNTNTNNPVLPNLPKDGRSHDFGVNFPEYLKNFPSVKHIPYLSDIAKLEWLKSLSYHARIKEIIGFDSIQKLNEEQLYNARFKFNNSFYLICSQYPLLEIQEFIDENINQDKNQEENDTNQGLSGSSAREATNKQISIKKNDFHYYAIYQKNHLISTAEIEESDFLFLQLLEEGRNFGDATDKCLSSFPQFDLSICISFMINNELIEKINYS